jgi:hypothetical protein
MRSCVSLQRARRSSGRVRSSRSASGSRSPEHEGFGFSPAWIRAALGLWVASMAVGGYGGRTARHARHLAERLAAEGDAPNAELHTLLGAPIPLAASYASGLLLLATLALMVWQPT